MKESDIVILAALVAAILLLAGGFLWVANGDLLMAGFLFGISLLACIVLVLVLEVTFRLLRWLLSR